MCLDGAESASQLPFDASSWAVFGELAHAADKLSVSRLIHSHAHDLYNPCTVEFRCALTEEVSGSLAGAAETRVQQSKSELCVALSSFCISAMYEQHINASTGSTSPCGSFIDLVLYVSLSTLMVLRGQAACSILSKPIATAVQCWSRCASV